MLISTPYPPEIPQITVFHNWVLNKFKFKGRDLLKSDVIDAEFSVALCISFSMSTEASAPPGCLAVDIGYDRDGKLLNRCER